MLLTSRFLRRGLVAGFAALSLTLAACSGDAPETSPSPETSDVQASGEPSPEESPSAEESPAATEEPTPEIEPSADLSEIEVSDEDTPVVSVPAPWAITQTTAEVLRESDNPQVLRDDSIVTINYVGVNGRTGEIFDSSYERGAPSTFQLQSVVAGFQKGLTGQHVGSRVLIGMPSEDGYPEGSGTQILAGDSLLFVVDIISANFDEATGAAVEPVEGLPVVTMETDGPVLEIPETDPPTELQVQPLIEGSGPVVGENSVISVKYRAWNWDTGEMIEDAWHPQQGPLNNLIEGWKQGLEGQPTGSRIMLVVPPELAYPNGNAANPTVEPGQTLIYVIDLLHSIDG